MMVFPETISLEPIREIGDEKGLFDYLMKPVDIGVIVERIKEAAAKHRTA